MARPTIGQIWQCRSQSWNARVTVVNEDRFQVHYNRIGQSPEGEFVTFKFQNQRSNMWCYLDSGANDGDLVNLLYDPSNNGAQ